MKGNLFSKKHSAVISEWGREEIRNRNRFKTESADMREGVK